ncbi:hypothetical protein [Bradyrhizobium hipponense]|uniref:hypothetical protein n=1 Tax=Bradyrhizobium hipponense TaxID=2605638 RepID=UPI001652CCE9
MIASDGGVNSERCRDRDAQDQGPSNGNGDLTEDKRQRTTGSSEKQRANDTSAGL